MESAFPQVSVLGIPAKAGSVSWPPSGIDSLLTECTDGTGNSDVWWDSIIVVAPLVQDAVTPQTSQGVPRVGWKSWTWWKRKTHGAGEGEERIMPNWTVSTVTQRWGWENGKPTMNEAALFAFNNIRESGYRRDITNYDYPMPTYDPRTSEKLWADYVDVMTGDGGRPRKIVGNPPSFEPDPDLIY